MQINPFLSGCCSLVNLVQWWNKKLYFFQDRNLLKVAMKGKLNLFFCFHGVANVVRKCKIFFSLDHDVVNVVTNCNNFFSWLQPVFLSWSSVSEGTSKIKKTFSRSWLENVAVKSLLLSSVASMMKGKILFFFLLTTA